MVAAKLSILLLLASFLVLIPGILAGVFLRGRRKNLRPFFLAIAAVLVLAIPALYWMRASRISSPEPAQATLMEQPAGGRPVPAPVPAPEPVLHTIRLKDDLAAWKRMDLSAPKVIGIGKPWVLDAAGSTAWEAAGAGLAVEARRPGPEGRLAGYSTELEPVIRDAQAAADRSAIGQLTASVLWELAHHPRNAGEGRQSYPDLEILARKIIRSALDRLILDRFDQSIVVHGQVYRSAVLVNAEPGTISKLADRLAEEVRSGEIGRIQQRRDVLAAAASAAGLAAFIFVLYCFLNAGTKGHFAWPLRLASLTSLAIIYAWLFWLRTWIQA